ncbi:MAG: hypothetical protein COV52_09595 [Gammaproteobacteria bacterium CG11_big_fil_rev_8_21_14_0_20_46_22]|nr:MAG: hypothetical protein COW05_04135 [Gammaproteobacteria bacterium CG12_big_fil_rev_8_21_14_0_65_46_12]PIR10267.1 MAG: hypothetical protein COV52_09595 [Gammaproteobacteria bacterium CG11_big_fil_rev_8_21_14_0_20_46_22]
MPSPYIVGSFLQNQEDDHLRLDLMCLVNWSYELYFGREKLPDISSLTELYATWRLITTSDDLIKKWPKKETKNNAHEYHGICVQRSDGLTAIVTPGTHPNPICFAAAPPSGPFGIPILSSNPIPSIPTTAIVPIIYPDPILMAHLKADVSVSVGKFPKKYCYAGEHFFNTVKKMYFNNDHSRMNGLMLAGHSLGCVFAYWMLKNGRLGSYPKTVCFETPRSHRLLIQLDIYEFGNVETILGSENWINGSKDGEGHVGYGVRVNTGNGDFASHSLVRLKQSYKEAVERSAQALPLNGITFFSCLRGNDFQRGGISSAAHNSANLPPPP